MIELYIDLLPSVLKGLAIGALVAAFTLILFKRVRTVANLSAVLGNLVFHGASFLSVLEHEKLRMQGGDMRGWYAIEAAIRMIYLAPLTLSLSVLFYFTVRRLNANMKR